MSTTTVPLSRAEYDLLVEAGALEGQPVELLAGRKVRMSPESALHAAVIDALADQLRRPASHAGLAVRVAHPLALSDIDEPEPDIAVVAARPDRYAAGHPEPDDVALIVEVAGTSRDKDLGDKAARYAAAGIDDYWVVDLQQHTTTVHRDPDGDHAIYRSVGTVAFGQPAAPLALPRAALRVEIPA